ncbi:MAG: N-6 DNA methylase, partial [Prevotellaceae bacterium]|nr:N-6 DNA methylase [Prevotellaceae bacterium]
MQNTQQQTTSAEYIINMAWNFMNHARGQMSVNDMFPLMLAFLYSYHKGYSIHVIDDRRFEFPQNDDNLLRDLVMCILPNMDMHVRVHGLCNEFALIDRDEFNTIYPDVLKGLFDLMSSNGGRSDGEFYTPSEVTKLMAYFVKKEGCISVFDPFCGTASIVHELADKSIPINYVGQELTLRTALYARLNIDAVYGYDCNITTCDSFSCWNDKHFDAVVSCPPLGLRLSERQLLETEHMNPEYPCRSVEDIMQIRSFHLNHADITVTLLAHGFCFRGNRDYELRRYLIDNNLVDAIVALPANILYGTAIPTVVLVCKRNRHSGEPVKFIHAEDYFQGDRRKRTFDFERYVEMVEGNACDCVEVSLDEIVKYDYNLNPSLYYKMDFDLKEGQQVKRMSELLEPVEGERISARDVAEMVSISNLSKDFIEVLLNNGKQSTQSEVRRNSNCRVFKASGSKYLFAFSNAGESRYGIDTDGKGF